MPQQRTAHRTQNNSRNLSPSSPRSLETASSRRTKKISAASGSGFLTPRSERLSYSNSLRLATRYFVANRAHRESPIPSFFRTTSTRPQHSARQEARRSAANSYKKFVTPLSSPLGAGVLTTRELFQDKEESVKEAEAGKRRMRPR